MKKYINLLFLWLLAFSSCVDEELMPQVSNEEEVNVSLNLYLPNPSQVATRAITFAEEAKVEVLKIMVFDNNGNYLPERSVSSVLVNDSEQTTDEDGGSLISKKISMKTTNENLSIVVLANVVNEGETNNGTLTTIPAIGNNETKSAYLARLAYEVNSKWNATSTEDYRRFPMWGEYSGTITAAPIEVDLLRALARINVSFSEDADTKFTLESIQVNNSLINGLIVPTSSLVNKNVTTPTLPGSPNVNTSLIYDGDAISNNACINEIYIPEAAKATSTTSYNGVYLTIAGKIGGVDKLYRVYMTSTGKADGTPLNILRNHTYKIYVSKVGSGENDIEVSIEEMSDVYMRSPYEQNTLTVSSNLFYFNPTNQTPATLNITTTWRDWDIVDANLDGFTIEKDLSNNKVVIMPSGFNQLASGSFYVQSGQLKKKILVKIDPEETANSYIRSESGSYQLNVSVKGNGRDGMIADGVRLVSEEDLKLAPTRVGIIWETSQGLVRLEDGQTSVVVDPMSFSGIVNYTVDLSKSPRNEGGNALIGAFNSKNECIWSWHIWVVPEFTNETPKTEVWKEAANVSYTFIDRYLGALSNTQGNVNSLGLLYQWGRKDPFIGAEEINKDTKSRSTYNYDPCGIGGNPYYWKVGGDNNNDLSYSIKNPTTLTKKGLCAEGIPQSYWGTKSGMNMVGNNANQTAVNEGNKTIYDPCPRGYRVPPVLAYIFGAGSNSNYYRNYDDNNRYKYYGFWLNFTETARPGNNITNKNVNRNKITWLPIAGVYDPKSVTATNNRYNGFSDVDGQSSIYINSIVWTNTPIGIKDGVGSNADFRPGALFLHGYVNNWNGDHLHAINETGGHQSSTGADSELYAQTQFAGSVRCVRDQEAQDFTSMNDFPKDVTLGASLGSTKSVSIKVINETWEVINPGAPWFYLDKYSGDPDGGEGQTLVFTASEDNPGKERSATLVVKTSKGSEYPIKVIQEEAPYTFRANPTSLQFDRNPNGATQKVTVSNEKYSWEVESGYPGWLTVNRSGNILTISASGNTGYGAWPRETTIRLKDSNEKTITISVNQKGFW